MTPDIDHLSYSSISTWLSCPAYWQYKYIQGLPSFGTPELAFGTAIHSTVEGYLQKKGELLDLWPHAWNNAHTDESRGKIVWGTDTPEQHCNEGYRILGNKDVISGINLIREHFGEGQIERKVELRVPGVDVPIIGYIDVLGKDGIPGDIKTSSKSWYQDRAKSELQTLFYLAALNQAGETVPGWKFRHYVIVKTKMPQFQMFEHDHRATEVFWLFEMIRKVWMSITLGVFVENPSSWRCSPAYCDYYKICRGRYDKNNLQ